MKKTHSIYCVTMASLVLGCLALMPMAGGATSSTNAAAGAKGKGKAATGTNVVKGPLVIPPSVFDVSLKPTKDPFFPLSMRSPVPATNKVAEPSISASSFALMALSGEPGHRLAMINHRTGAVGEALDVTTKAGTKATIRVLDIKESSVIIRVIAPPQGDLIELSLSKRAIGTTY